MPNLCLIACIVALCVPRCMSSRTTVSADAVPGYYNSGHTKLVLLQNSEFVLSDGTKVLTGRWVLGEAWDYYLCEGDQLVFLKNPEFLTLGPGGLKAHFERTHGKLAMRFDNAPSELSNERLIKGNAADGGEVRP